MPRVVYKRHAVKVVESRKVEVPEDLKNNVYDMPEFLKTLTVATKRGVAVTKMAEAIKALPKGKCLVYSIVQLEELLGHPITNLKMTGNAIRAKLKVCGIDRPRCVPDGGKLFIFSNDLT